MSPVVSTEIFVGTKAGVMRSLHKGTVVGSEVVSNRFPGDPGPGKLYWGESVGGGDPTARETFYGKQVGIYRSYWQATDQAAMFAVATRDLGKKRLPFISAKMPATWAAMASGSQDSWIDSLMAGFASVGGPILFCPHHEPYDNQGAGQTPADYVAMCTRFRNRKGAATNVSIAPNLQSAPFDRTVGGGQNLSNWFDANSHDVLSLNGYNHWSGVFDGGGNLTGTVNKWRTPAQVFSVISQNVWGKPVVIGEWGVRTDPRTPGLAAQWMTDARAYLLSLGNVVGACFFDSNLNVNDGGTPWSLDDRGTERLDRFKLLLNSTDGANAFLP